MIEVKDITKEPEYQSMKYGPLCHHKDKEKVLKKARELWGEDFKIGQAVNSSYPRWVAVSTRKVAGA